MSENSNSEPAALWLILGGVAAVVVILAGAYLVSARLAGSPGDDGDSVLSVTPPEQLEDSQAWHEFREQQLELLEQRVEKTEEVPLKVAESSVASELEFFDLTLLQEPVDSIDSVAQLADLEDRSVPLEADGEWVILSGYIQYPTESGQGADYRIPYLSKEQDPGASGSMLPPQMSMIDLRGARAKGFSRGEQVRVLGRVLLEAGRHEALVKKMTLGMNPEQAEQQREQRLAQAQREWDEALHNGDWWKHVRLTPHLAVRNVYDKERKSRVITGGEEALEGFEANRSDWRFAELDSGEVVFHILNSSTLINGQPALIYRYGNGEDSEVRYLSFDPQSGDFTRHTVVSGVNPSRLTLVELNGRPAFSFRDFNEEKVYFVAADSPFPASASNWHRSVVTDDPEMLRPGLAVVDGKPAMCLLDYSDPGVDFYQAHREAPRSVEHWSGPERILEAFDKSESFPSQDNPYCEVTGYQGRPFVLASDITQPRGSSRVVWRNSDGEWAEDGINGNQISFLQGSDRPDIFTRGPVSESDRPVSLFRYQEGPNWSRVRLTESPELGPRFAAAGSDGIPRFFYTTRLDHSSENSTDMETSLHLATPSVSEPEGPDDWERLLVDEGRHLDSAHRTISGGLTAVVWNGRAVAFYDRCNFTRAREREDRNQHGEEANNGWRCSLIAAVEKSQ